MIILIVMVLGLGVLSYLKMPMEFLPEADQPMVTVTVVGPGYDASSMEQNVTNPIEQAVAGVKGAISVTSTSGDSFSQIMMFFDSQTDMKEAKSEVERSVNAVKLPERVSEPFVVQLNTSMIPISVANLTFNDNVEEARKERLEQQVVDAFRSVDGVGNVQLGGKSAPQITIVPDPVKLAAKGVPFQALYGAIQGREASASVGERVLDGTAVNLNVSAKLGNVETLKRLPVAAGVVLGDVAEVKLVNEPESVLRYQGKSAMQIVITKAANANAVTVGKAIEKKADEIAAENPDLNLRFIFSTSSEVVHSVNSMMREVLMGALFATLVILMFMRNVRATLITIVSIPLSLALTLYLLDLSGISLNVLTLGGVAVAVGRLVDDSIVVIENIFRRLQKDKFSASLVIEATSEMSRAITVSTLCTVAVFLPVGLLRGSLQDFLLPFALTVTYSLLASLLVALTVIPLMSAGILKTAKIKEHVPSERFRRFLAWNLRFKWIPIAVAVVLLFGSVATYFSMPKGAIDSSGAQNLIVTMAYKPDTPAEQVFENGKKMEAFLMKQEGQEWVMMQIGNSADAAKWGQVVSPTLVTLQLQMKEGADAGQIIEAVKKERANYPGANVNASQGQLFGGGSGTQITIDVTGSDPVPIGNTAAAVMSAIKPIPDVLKVESNQEEKKTVYTLQVDPARAKAGDIAQQLQGMLNPVPIGAVNMDGQSVPVTLSPVIDPRSPADLDRLTVMTEQGPKPVSSFAKWVKEEKAAKYFHKDGKSFVRVTATVEPSQLSIVGDKINKEIAKIQTPEGVKISTGGAFADQAGDFSDLFMVMIVSIAIVFLIMVFTFKTIRASLAVLCSIPLVSIGAVLGLLITGISPDFTAIFGVVMLIGIVVTNAIVLMDRVRHNEATMTIREAILEAAGTRMRPILMTAVATVCAMLPLVFGASESGSIVSQSLAIVVIGGLIVATMLTLVVVPCIYELLFFRKSARQRRATQRHIAA